MLTGIQVVALLFGLGQCYFTYLHWRRNEFTWKEMAVWLLVWASFIFATVFPVGFASLSLAFGAVRPLDLFTVLGFIVTLSLTFTAYVGVDRQRKRLTKLVEDLALLEVDGEFTSKK